MTHTSAPHVLVLETPGLGNREYIAHDGTHAVVIDPQRDSDRIEHLLAEHGLTVTHVVETHLHNDYVTGGLELARRHAAQYLVPADAEVPYEHTPVSDGDTFEVGTLTLHVIATPGHTPHHKSYSVQRGDHPGAVFTGGSMLYGAVGRPDLVTPEVTEGLARDQFRSVQHLADALDRATFVYPTHGFGSFCAATQNDGPSGTIADERSNNPALTQDEESFVATTLAGLDVFPAYYAHMGPANESGPAPIDLELPTPADPVELRARIERGEWVVDLRSREVFAAGHLRGSLSFDLDGAFATYVGWLIPWGTPITLLGETTEQVRAAQRELVRIGIDRPAAQAVGGPAYWAADAEPLETVERVDFAKLAKIRENDPTVFLLDIRQHQEWEGSHVVGALHIPFYRVSERLADIPRDRTVYVSCGSGYRAAAVVSLLRGRGFDNLVHVDDDWDNAAHTSLPLTTEQPPAREVGWTWRESRSTAHTYQGATETVTA